MTVVDFQAGTRSSHGSTDTHRVLAAAGAADFPDGHRPSDAHTERAVGENDSQPTMAVPMPSVVASAGPDFPDGHEGHDTQRSPAAGERKLSAPANGRPTPEAHTPVLVSNPWTDSNAPLLALLADVLDDLERTRIANENRLRQLTRDEPDADGEERGFGLTLDQPQVAALADVVEALGKLEHQSTLNLQRALRKHPLGPWVKATVGVGEKQGARLIAAIGDPYWNTLHDRPRIVSELWAYCGLHVLPAAQFTADAQGLHGGGGKQGDPGHAAVDTQSRTAGVAPTRARGQRANWSTTAKKRAWLIAESCKKQRCAACRDLDGKHADDCTCSPYRVLYDAGRTKYADAVHETPCRRCGPKGNPASIGSPLSAAHQEARAYRLVMKELLKDLWHESKRIHDGGAS